MDQNLIDEIITTAQEMAANNDEKGLRNILACFDRLYYQPTIDEGVPDAIYDQVVEIYDEKFGKKKTYHQKKGVGAKGQASADTRKDVKLPYYMGTVNKFSAMMVDATKGLSKWRNRPVNYEKKFKAWKKKYPKGPYTVEGKADGISCLLIYEKKNGVIKRTIYSRGTGKTGKDLSRYIQNLREGFNLIPSGEDFNFPPEDKIVIRGELVMRYRVWKRKYSEDFSNPRNIVGGFVTKKTNSGVSTRDIEFVAYEKLVPRDETRFDQIETLKKMGFATVEVTQLSKNSELTEKNLFKILKSFRKKSPYEIDGLVVFADDKVRKVSDKEVLDSAFAYKVNAQTAIADVVGVEWSSSTTNALKPVVVYKPVTIGRVMEDGSIVGAVYRRATAFNANFIKKNKIGPGAKLLIVRSGDVIPHIEQVLKQGKPDLPNKERPPQPKYDYKGHPEINFEWGDGNNRRSKLDIFAVEMLDDAKIQQMDLFFSGGRQKRGMNIKGIAKKTLRHLFQEGFDSITSILQASEEDLAEALGKPGVAANIKQAIDERFSTPVDLAQIMGASQVFPHVRTKTAAKIIAKYPDIMKMGPKELKKIKAVSGVGQDTLDGFAAAMPMFKLFLRDNPQIKIAAKPVTKKPTSNKLQGKIFVFTGTMDKMKREDAQNLVEDMGGKAPGTLNKKVDFLVIGDKGGAGKKKLSQAEKFDTPIISETDFLTMIGYLPTMRNQRR